MKTNFGLFGRIGLMLGLAGTLALPLAGCSLNSAIPKTQVTGSLGGKPFTLETPKDNDLTGLDVSCDTNGTVRVHIDTLTSNLNPTNVANAGTAQAQIITATGDVILKGIQAGAAAAGTAMGAAAKAP